MTRMGFKSWAGATVARNLKARDLLMVRNALEHVDGGPSNEYNSFVVPASFFTGEGDAQKGWDGVLLATPDRLLHLEWPLVVPEATGPSNPPLTLMFSDLAGCRFLLPPDFPRGRSGPNVSYAAPPQGHGPHMFVQLVDGRVARFALPYKDDGSAASTFVRAKIIDLVRLVSAMVLADAGELLD